MNLIKYIYSEIKTTFSFGGIFPIFIIIIPFFSSSPINIAALPEAIASVYLINVFSLFVTFEFTVMESPILAWKELKSILGSF